MEERSVQNAVVISNSKPSNIQGVSCGETEGRVINKYLRRIRWWNVDVLVRFVPIYDQRSWNPSDKLLTSYKLGRTSSAIETEVLPRHAKPCISEIKPSNTFVINMKRKAYRNLFRLTVAIAVCAWLSGCAYTTRGLVTNTGKRNTRITTVSTATLDEEKIQAHCRGLMVERGLPELNLGFSVPRSHDITVEFEGDFVFDIEDATPNLPRDQIPPCQLSTANSLDNGTSLAVLSSNHVDFIEFAERRTDILTFVPVNMDVCILQRRITKQHSEIAFLRRSQDGCDVYPFRLGIADVDKARSRFWKIPCYLPVTIVWDAINTIVTPPLYLYGLLTEDWLPK